MDENQGKLDRLQIRISVGQKRAVESFARSRDIPVGQVVREALWAWIKSGGELAGGEAGRGGSHGLVEGRAVEVVQQVMPAQKEGACVEIRPLSNEEFRCMKELQARKAKGRLDPPWALKLMELEARYAGET
jgi:hypothetical protein